MTNVLMAKIGASVIRNKDLFFFENGVNKETQVLFVNKLCKEAADFFYSEEEFYARSARCQLDDCNKHVVIRPRNGLHELYNGIYMNRCSFIRNLYDFMSDGNNKWLDVRKRVMRADDLPAFVFDIFLELGHDFTVKILPNLRENVWREVIGDANADTTINVSPIMDYFISAMASILPVYSMHKNKFAFKQSTPLFYAACECLMNPSRPEVIRSLEEKFSCELTRTYMVNQLLMYKIASSVLPLDEELLIKNKPDVYLTMSQIFSKFVASDDSSKQTKRVPSFCMQQVQPLFIEKEDEKGRKRGVGYLYRIGNDVHDMEFIKTMKDMLHFSDTVDPIALKQEMFCTKFKILGIDTSCIHAADVVKGCFNEKEVSEFSLVDNSANNAQHECDLILGKFKEHKLNFDNKRHIILDANMYVIIDNVYDREQTLGGALFGLIVSSHTKTLDNGEMTCVFLPMLRLFSMNSVTAVRWVLTICHYWLFGNVRAALKAQATLDEEHLPFVHQFVAPIMEYFINKLVVGEFYAHMPGYVEPMLAMFVGLMLSFDPDVNPEGLDGFPSHCAELKLSSNSRVQWPDVKAQLFANQKYAPRSDKGMPFSTRRIESMFGAHVKKINTEEQTEVTVEEESTMEAMALFFCMASGIRGRECVLMMEKTKTMVEDAQMTWIKFVNSHTFPVFYHHDKQEHMSSDCLYFLPYAETTRVIAEQGVPYSMHLTAACEDKNVPDCDKVVLSANGSKPHYFQLYNELE